MCHGPKLSNHFPFQLFKEITLTKGKNYGVYKTIFKALTHHIMLCAYRFRFMEKCVAKDVHRFLIVNLKE
jgi:hypothetical protein